MKYTLTLLFLMLFGLSVSIVSAQEPVTIRVMTQVNELSPEQIASFEALNPDIKIELIDSDSISLDLAISTGDIPDVFRVSHVRALVLEGRLLPLNDYFETSSIITFDDIADVANYFVVDGLYYSLPKDWSGDFSVWVSNAAFEEAGLPIPDASQPLTYAELADLARQLTVRDGDTVVMPGFFIPNYLFTFTHILVQHGTSMFNEDYTELQLTDNPVAMDVVRFFYDLSLEGLINLNWDQMGDAWGAGLPMVQWGYWYGGSIPSDNPLYGNLTMLPAPTWNHDLPRVNPSGGPVGLAISATTEHPDEAYRFFEWYIVGELGRERTAGGWGAPALKSMFELLPQDTPFNQQRYAVLVNDLPYSNYQLPNYPYTATNDAFNFAWMQHIQRAVAGEIDFETFATDLQETVNLAILNEQLGQ